MDFAVLILASAAIPLLAHNAFWAYREKGTEYYYGIISGAYTLIAAFGVSMGFPGNLIMPVTFTIIGIGSLHGYLKEKKRLKIFKSILFLALGILIFAMGVMV